MQPWTDERVWDAVDEWRWAPPGATRVATPEFELIVTPGAYNLTYIYGFRVDGSERAEEKIREVRALIERHGGTGGRFQLTPRSRPPDLGRRLQRHGYQPKEETEVLVWELRDDRDQARMPGSTDVGGTTVREAATAGEFDAFLDLGHSIFGDPLPPAEIRAKFHEEFRRAREAHEPTGCFLAWSGSEPEPVGRAGLQVVGRAARFWGTGVLSSHRHRGVYRALVRARTEAGVAQGAEIALVTARVGSSGPILKRMGFRTVGEIRMYEAHWSDAGRPPAEVGTPSQARGPHA